MVKAYPEADANIIGLLRRKGDIVCHDAAARIVELEKKIAELTTDLYERDMAMQNESEALGSAEIAAAKLEQENAALKEAFTAAYKILMSDYGIYEACRTLREAMERSGEGDER